MKNQATVAAFLLLALQAVAGEDGGRKPPSDPSVTVKQNTHANAKANANANSKSSSNATSDSNAFGGDASAQGGSSQAITTSNYPQQAPAVAQGSFAIVGCQAAGNVGGSNTHGSAFLGFGFTPDECYRFMLAQAYQAIGQTEAACEVLNRTDALLNLEAKRNMPLPNCKPAPPVVVEQHVDSVSHAELQEVEQRIVEKVVTK